MLQKSKSAIFDGCNPLKYRDTIPDKNVKNWFLQQNHPPSISPPTTAQQVDNAPQLLGRGRQGAFLCRQVKSFLVGVTGGTVR
jgi:hypothetical protein